MAIIDYVNIGNCLVSNHWQLLILRTFVVIDSQEIHNLLMMIMAIIDHVNIGSC